LDRVAYLVFPSAVGEHDEVVALHDAPRIFVEHDAGIAEVVLVSARLVSNAHLEGEPFGYAILKVGVGHVVQHLGGEVFAGEPGIGDLLHQ
jgi:hypothetical protein